MVRGRYRESLLIRGHILTIAEVLMALLLTRAPHGDGCPADGGVGVGGVGGVGWGGGPTSYERKELKAAE